MNCFELERSKKYVSFIKEYKGCVFTLLGVDCDKRFLFFDVTNQKNYTFPLSSFFLSSLSLYKEQIMNKFITGKQFNFRGIELTCNGEFFHNRISFDNKTMLLHVATDDPLLNEFKEIKFEIKEGETWKIRDGRTATVLLDKRSRKYKGDFPFLMCIDDNTAYYYSVTKDGTFYNVNVVDRGEHGHDLIEKVKDTEKKGVEFYVRCNSREPDLDDDIDKLTRVYTSGNIHKEQPQVGEASQYPIIKKFVVTELPLDEAK